MLKGANGTRTVEINGKKVTIDDSLFDPDFIDLDTGKTNLQLMAEGKDPFGYDGKKIHIHHIDQTNNGPVMEITATEHQQNYKELHSNIGQSPSQIDRNAFTKWRVEYWKWRMNNLK